MRVGLWEPARVPKGFRELWSVRLGSLSGLAALRARLRTALTGREPDQLVLVADELASNALRHGAPPVSTSLSRCGDEWLITVTDSDPNLPPTPAVGRDPGLGGLGLYLVADLSARHGWFVTHGLKTAWAVVRAPCTVGAARSGGPVPTPR